MRDYVYNPTGKPLGITSPVPKRPFFQFKMELEDVGGDGQERPFRRDLGRSSAQESAIFQVLFGEGKGTFGLDGAIDAQQLAFRGIDLRFHGLPLGGKALGYVDDLAALLQWPFASAGTNALLLQWASLAVIANIDRCRDAQAARRFGVLVMVVPYRLARCAGIGVAVRIIRHVLPPADVRAVLFLLSHFMV